MSRPSSRSFSFELQFQFEFACSVHIASTSDEEVKLADPTHAVDAKEAELSPIARQMQQLARERAQHRRSKTEVAEDDESLYHLEVETINNTPLAKQVDRRSLELLVRITKQLDQCYPSLYHASLVTPRRTSFWPPKPRRCEPPRHFKGMNATPMSFEPPFSTTSDIRGMYEPQARSNADNEFELFLAKNRLLSNAAAYFPEKVAKATKGSPFNDLLRSAKSKSEPDVKAMTKKEYSAHIQREAQSVLDLMALADKRDEEEQLLADAIESPIPSPTRSIKHLPRCTSSGNLSAMSMGIADLTDEHEARFVSPTKFDDIDGGYAADGGSGSGSDSDSDSEGEEGEDAPDGYDAGGEDGDVEEHNGGEGLGTPDSDSSESDSDSEWEKL